MSYKVIRSHEICAGHRVVGHESKCRHLHGHNYVFHFHVAPLRDKVNVTLPGASLNLKQDLPAVQMTTNDRTKLDDLGRVVDFSVVKSTLCQWLEDNWDHKFLHWENDPLFKKVRQCIHHEIATGEQDPCEHTDAYFGSLVSLPFNPTAENLAAHMVNVIGPMLLAEHGVELVTCVIEETSKCHVEYSR